MRMKSDFVSKKRKLKIHTCPIFIKVYASYYNKTEMSRFDSLYNIILCCLPKLLFAQMNKNLLPTD